MRQPRRLKFKVTPQQRDTLAHSWQFRILIAAERAEARQPDDPLFRILCAALRLPTKSPPWCGPSAIVVEEGLVVCNYVDAGNHQLGPTAMCSLADLVGNLKNLAESEGFTQAEVDPLFAALRQWITHDNRPEAKEQAAERLGHGW